MVDQITVTAAGEETFTSKERLTPNVVMSLARFTERVSVQQAMNDMYCRMVSIGWVVTIKNATLLAEDKIEIARTDGTVITYAPTNADMVRLRHDLDHAETHWIIGDKMPLFRDAGWNVQEASDGGYYILFKPDGSFETVTFGRVDQAKAAVKLAEEALTTIKATTYANEIAEKFNL